MVNRKTIMDFDTLDFNTFWELYPRKKGTSKKVAKRRFDNLSPEDRKLALEGLERQLGELKSREPQFIPHASTWLNQERWNDGEDDLTPFVCPTSFAGIVKSAEDPDWMNIFKHYLNGEVYRFIMEVFHVFSEHGGSYSAIIFKLLLKRPDLVKLFKEHGLFKNDIKDVELMVSVANN